MFLFKYLLHSRCGKIINIVIKVDFFRIKFCLLKFEIYICSPKRGAIAQSVEQWTENPCVPGSIPGGTTSLNRRTRKINVLRVFCF
jgi:hypothetical protein